ncbi:CHC2 zinc finger domain-containing protein [Candidatus Vidania fulgoroideorum]
MKIIKKINKLIKLKFNNKRIWALCPFHSEKKESFLLNKNYFYCFGCRKSGSLEYLLKFLKLKLNVNFLIKFENLLKKNNKKNKFLNKYLNSRKFYNLRKIKKFIYNANFINFKKELNKNLIIKLIKSKILYYNKRNKIDFYKNSLVIPIRDLNGLVRTFCIRKIYGEPKYFFSKYSNKFSKKNTIFGYYEYIKNRCFNKNEIFIVEGFFDFFRLYNMGVKNVLCLMGSYISKTQLKYILKLNKNIVFIMDFDFAGFKFYFDLINKIINNFKKINIIFFLIIKKKDPDIFFQNFKKNEFLKYYILKKINVFEFIFLNIEYFKKIKFIKKILISKYSIFIKNIRYIKLIKFYLNFHKKFLI